MVGLFLENLSRHLDGRHRPRPPGVEGQVNNHLSKFRFRQAVLLSPAQVVWKLFRIAVGDEGSDGDQAAICLLYTSRCV